MKFRFGFTNETGAASKFLETAPFTVLPPDPNASVQLDLGDQFIFAGAAGDKGEIFAMSMTTGEAIRVSPDSLGADCPVVSHDGRRILFVGNSDVWVMKSDGSEMRRVMPRPSDDAWFHRCPSWSPDDKRFVWVTMVPMVKQPSPGAIYLVDVETGAATTLMTGSNFSSADWSPDGQHILVGANQYTDGGPYDFSVSVLRLDGTKISQVAASTWGASWAPDGASFGYLCGESVLSLCVADTTGANVRLVTDSVYSKPYWSPDGGRIAFIGNGGVYLVSVDGRARRMLYPVKPSFDITWSPDARRIAWACGGGSNGNDICRIGADGTGFFRMQTTVSAAQITWPPLM